MNTFSQTFNLDLLTNEVPDLAEYILYSYLPKENFFLTLGLIPGYNGKRIFTGAQMIGDGFGVRLNMNIH